MAGDWIKMRMDLFTHPKIFRMVSALQADKFRIVGGLHAVWCVFDCHSEDGQLIGYTSDVMDGIIGWSGFCKAMIDIGWLEETTQALVMPRFNEHNGKSAKRRANDAVRKQEARKPPFNADTLRTECGHHAEKSVTREEKRREEVKHLSPDGENVGQGSEEKSDPFTDWAGKFVRYYNQQTEGLGHKKAPSATKAITKALRKLYDHKETCGDEVIRFKDTNMAALYIRAIAECQWAAQNQVELLSLIRGPMFDKLVLRSIEMLTEETVNAE